MSVISSLAELFRAGAVPSVEGTFASGGGRAKAVENLTARLGAGVTAPANLINQALARVQLAGQRGSAIERGETVAPSDIPIDPTLPTETSFRYRVRVIATVSNPRTPLEPSRIDTVIPVDSQTPLSRQEIIDRVRPAAEMLRGSERYPQIQNVIRGIETGQTEITDYQIVSAYRNVLA